MTVKKTDGKKKTSPKTREKTVPKKPEGKSAPKRPAPGRGTKSSAPGRGPKKPVKTSKKTLPAPEKAPSKSDQRVEALRKMLLAKRQQIVSEAKTEISKYIKGENRQLVDTALDEGDWSVVDLSEDVVFRKLGVHKDMLYKIDESLRKLNEGSYGVCDDCGDEINPERLRVLPFAIFCRDCQERKELWEAMERT